MDEFEKELRLKRNDQKYSVKAKLEIHTSSNFKYSFLKMITIYDFAFQNLKACMKFTVLYLRLIFKNLRFDHIYGLIFFIPLYFYFKSN